MTTILHKRGKNKPEAEMFESVGEILIDTVEGVGYTLTDDGEVSAVGGDSIWNEVPQPNSKDYRWVTLKDQSTGDDEYGFRIQYCTRVEDPDNPDPDFPNGPWDNAELRIREINAKKSDIATVNAINLDAVDAKVVEQQVLGGIQILGANQERPDELPDKTADGKSIQYALTVFHETLGRSVVIDKEGIIRANQFTDMQGNPIGGGGAEAIEATFYESVQLVPTSTDTGGSTQEYKDVWVVDDNNGEDASSRTNIYAAGAFTARAVDAGTVRSYACNLDASGTGLKTPSIVSGRITTVEHTVFGGINIPAADEERPDGLPYSPDEKSIQYAFTVTHETLGRTVEIDKEGIIRARDFTDLDGNSIVNKQQVVTQSEYDSLTPDPDTVYFII